MKIRGNVVHVPFSKDIIIPRVPEDVVFTARAVNFIEEFEEKVEEPKRTKKFGKDGTFVGYKENDTKYEEASQNYHRKRLDFMVIKSLEEDITFDSVDLDDPETWKNWRKEFQAAGFSEAECGKILNDVANVHSPSQEMVDEMKKDFLATQSQEDKNQTIQEDEPTST